MELSKKDKKIAREIIEMGLQQEYAKGLYKFDSILDEWKAKINNDEESYELLCKAVIQYDKQIARRYDPLKASNYIFIIAGQLNEDLIQETELDGLSDEVKGAIKMIREM